MSNLTRDTLIKTIVANEMKLHNGSDYSETLKNTYHKWEHESSIVLCEKFNQINNTNINVEILEP